jgi:integrase
VYATELEAYLDYLAASGAPATTLRLRRGHLERALTWIGKPPWAVRHEDLVAYGAAHTAWAQNTRKSVRTSLCSFYRWGERTGLVPDDYARNLPAVHVPPGKPRPAPTDVLDIAMTKAEPRVTLMLMLGALAGMRRTEIARLHSDDILEDDIRIVGKGGVVRLVPIHALLADALEGHPAGYVFPGQEDGHLSAHHVGKTMAKALGENNHWTAHTLRHRFATRAYAGDHDILSVRELLGHSSVATTQIYTQVPRDALRRAVAHVA